MYPIWIGTESSAKSSYTTARYKVSFDELESTPRVLPSSHSTVRRDPSHFSQLNERVDIIPRSSIDTKCARTSPGHSDRRVDPTEEPLTHLTV